MVVRGCRKEHSQRVHKHFEGVGFTGVKNFFRSKWVISGIFWFIIIGTAAAVAIYMTVLIVDSFINSPTVTKIDFMVTNEVVYPVITVCDSGGSFFLDGTKLQKANISRLDVGSLLLLGPLFILPNPDSPYQHWANVSDKLIEEKQLKWLENGQKPEAEAVWDFLHNYAVDCSQIFHDCLTADFTSFNCCEVFQPVIRPVHGICFASDINKMVKAHSPQLFSSLFIRFVDPDSLFNPTGTKAEIPNQLEITLDDGVDQSLWRSDFLPLNFGYTTTANLDITRIVEESSATNPCFEEAELESFQDYTYDNCMWEKRFLLNPNFTKLLNCSLPITQLTKVKFTADKLVISKKESQPVCSYATLKHVIFDDFKDSRQFDSGSRRLIEFWFQKLNMSDENPCEDTCDSWEYKWETSQERNVKDNISQLVLTITNVLYPVVQEVPSMEWPDFLGIIGGTWGLMFGASVMSFVQLFVGFCRHFCISKLTTKEEKSGRYDIATAETSFSYVPDVIRQSIKH